MKTTALVPEFLELEDFRRSVNRKIWAVIGLLGLVSLLSLGLALIAFARPIPVVAFDKEGHAILFDDTVTARVRLDDLRIEAFAQAFLERWACVDSTNVSEDFTKALNWMTPGYRRIVLADENEMDHRRKWAAYNLKSAIDTFETKISAYDPLDVHAKIYLVAHGKMRFVPKLGDHEESKEAVKYYTSELVLVRVPVSKEAIHGLLVDHARTLLFDTEEEMNVEALKRKAE